MDYQFGVRVYIELIDGDNKMQNTNDIQSWNEWHCVPNPHLH